MNENGNVNGNENEIRDHEKDFCGFVCESNDLISFASRREIPVISAVINKKNQTTTC
jgi:hypothetical protein